jgi:hypothetical protein
MGKKKELKIKRIACSFGYYLANNYEYEDDTEKGSLFKERHCNNKMILEDIYEHWLFLMSI